MNSSSSRSLPGSKRTKAKKKKNSHQPQGRNGFLWGPKTHKKRDNLVQKGKKGGGGVIFRTLQIETRDHITKLLHVPSHIRTRRDPVQSREAVDGEPCGDAGKLIWGAKLGKPSTDQAKAGHILGLGRQRRTGRLEALHRQIGPPVDADDLIGIGLNEVEDITQKFVGQTFHGDLLISGIDPPSTVLASSSLFSFFVLSSHIRKPEWRANKCLAKAHAPTELLCPRSAAGIS